MTRAFKMQSCRGHGSAALVMLLSCRGGRFWPKFEFLGVNGKNQPGEPPHLTKRSFPVAVLAQRQVIALQASLRLRLINN